SPVDRLVGEVSATVGGSLSPVDGGGGGGEPPPEAVSSSQTLPMPTAGSEPKKAFVHWPASVTLFCIQRVSEPKRTVCVPLTVKRWLSSAMRTHCDGGDVPPSLSTWQTLPMPKAGSEPKKAFVHWPVLVTLFCTQRVSEPKRTVCVPLTVKFWF